MTRWTAMLTIAGLLIAAGLLPLAPLNAGPTPAAAPQGQLVKVELLDLALVDQDGRKVRFKTDEIGDRLVVIDTF